MIKAYDRDLDVGIGTKDGTYYVRLIFDTRTNKGTFRAHLSYNEAKELGRMLINLADGLDCKDQIEAKNKYIRRQESRKRCEKKLVELYKKREVEYLEERLRELKNG